MCVSDGRCIEWGGLHPSCIVPPIIYDIRGLSLLSPSRRYLSSVKVADTDPLLCLRKLVHSSSFSRWVTFPVEGLSVFLDFWMKEYRSTCVGHFGPFVYRSIGVRRFWTASRHHLFCRWRKKLVDSSSRASTSTRWRKKLIVEGEYIDVSSGRPLFIRWRQGRSSSSTVRRSRASRSDPFVLQFKIPRFCGEDSSFVLNLHSRDD